MTRSKIHTIANSNVNSLAPNKSLDTIQQVPVQEIECVTPRRDFEIDVPYSAGFAYNPGLIKMPSGFRMYFRGEVSGSTDTEIFYVDLDEHFEVKSDARLCKFIRVSSKIHTLDDPRVLWHKDRIHVVHAQGYAAGTANGWAWTSAVCVAEHSDSGIWDQSKCYDYGRNLNVSSSMKSALIAGEKNWSPFVYQGMLHFTYSLNPLIILKIDPEEPKPIVVASTGWDSSAWSWGSFLGGGTPFIRRSGSTYGAFFHSFLDERVSEYNRRRYFVGYIEIDMSTHRVVRMSRMPIMAAVPDIKLDKRASTKRFWQPNCVYPCGIVDNGLSVYMSYGWQDCRCKVAEYAWSDIEASCMEIL